MVSSSANVSRPVSVIAYVKKYSIWPRVNGGLAQNINKKLKGKKCVSSIDDDVTFSLLTLGRLTFSLLSFGRLTSSRMKFGIMTLNIINVIWRNDFKHNKIWHNVIKHNGIWQKEYAFGIGELSLMALSRMTFYITTFSTFSIII